MARSEIRATHLLQHIYPGASFNATIPATANTIPAIFAGFSVSPKSTTPMISVPATPLRRELQ
jgi:hypothetical protein